MTTKSNTRRRNLVLLRAGDSSIHSCWLEAAGETRNWDLIINYFDDNPDAFRGGDWLRIDSKGTKLQGLYDFIRNHEEMIRQYDYIWLPDEDLECTCQGINQMFDVCRERELKLAQPALTHDSYFTHPVTLRCRSFKIRFTTFVEMMAPCFSVESLWQVLPTMDGTFSGWGTDFVWSQMLSADPRSIAIIDDIQMRHTRPVGGGKLYDLVKEMGQCAWDEQLSVEKKHGIRWHRYGIHEGILHSGRSVKNGFLVLCIYAMDLLRATPRMKLRWRQLPHMFASAVWQQVKGRRPLEPLEAHPLLRRSNERSSHERPV